MLDVDPGVRQMEIGLVRPLLRRRGIMLMDAFVPEGNAVEVEEVGDLAFLEAPDPVALQRSDLVAADIVPVLAPGSGTRAGSCRARTRPGTTSAAIPRTFARGQIVNDRLQPVEQGLVDFGCLGQGRAPAFGFSDDVHAQIAERPHGNAARRFVAATLADPFLHLVSGILREARSSSSDGHRQPLWRSQPALATITEVLPLPAAATTRLRPSSTTTARRCSSVSGRASIRSKNARDRDRSFATKLAFAFTRIRSGASRNSSIALSIRISGLSDSVLGHRAAN